MLNIISNWRRERSAVSQLSRLSDRELADLGIQRQDIKAVARFASTMRRDEVAAIVKLGQTAQPSRVPCRPFCVGGHVEIAFVASAAKG